MTFGSSGNRRGLALGVKRGFKRATRVDAPPPAAPGERILDGIPGFLVWVSLILVSVGAVYAPIPVVTVGALIGAYMAVRMLMAATANLMGLRRIRQWERTDWRAEYERRKTAHSLAWEQVRHVIIIPNYKEELSVLRGTLTRLAASPLARNQIIVALAMEAGDPNAASTAATLRAEFEHQFLSILPTLHPKGIAGEVAGKSSNVAWSARHVANTLVDEMGISLDQTVVTVGDADSILHVHYLECLNCLFAVSPKRHMAIWQAPIRYNGNVWDVHPSLAIVQAYSAAWELAYMSGSWWQALPMSTYSLGMRLASDVGFWDANVIAEDWHMFIKCYFGRQGLLEFAPIYLPFSACSVTGDTFLESCRNRYTQTLRHAWGAKEIGYTIKRMVEKPIPLHRAVRVLLRVSHDNLMAGAGWVIMTVGTQLPLVLNPKLFSERFFAPEFLLIQMSLLMVITVGILFYLIDLKMRPPRPRAITVVDIGMTLSSFVILGFLVLILVALPVIEAQTRLMLGVPLEYKVARKV